MTKRSKAKQSKCVFSVREQMEFVGGYTILMVHAATPWIVTGNNGSVLSARQPNTHTHMLLPSSAFCMLEMDGMDYSYMNGSVCVCV